MQPGGRDVFVFFFGGGTPLFFWGDKIVNLRLSETVRLAFFLKALQALLPFQKLYLLLLMECTLMICTNNVGF